MKVVLDLNRPRLLFEVKMDAEVEENTEFPADVHYHGIGLHSHCFLLAVAGIHKHRVEQEAGQHSLLDCTEGSVVDLHSVMIDWDVEYSQGLREAEGIRCFAGNKNRPRR